MALFTFLESGQNLFIKYVSITASVQILIPLGFSAAFSWMLLYACIKKLPLASSQWKIHLLRSVLEVTGTLCWFKAITLIPLSLAKGLNSISPLLVVCLACLLLGEKTSRWQWLGLLMGWAGALIILRPDMHAIGAGEIYAVFGTLCFSVCGLLIKRLTTKEPPLRIALYMLGFTALLSLPLGLNEAMPDNSTLSFIPLLGLIIAALQFTVARAYGTAPLVVLMPMSFLSLIFVTMGDYMFFAEIPLLSTFMGAGVILSAIALAEYKRKRC